MTDNIKQFLEADALRTQGEWEVEYRLPELAHHSKRVHCNGATIADMRLKNGDKDAPFIAAASRIAPDIRQLLAAFEQVCEALENIQHESEGDCNSRKNCGVYHDRGMTCPDCPLWISHIARKSLTAAAPYRKGGV